MKQDTKEMEKYRERFQNTVKAAHICVFEIDLKNQQYDFFENAEDFFGLSGEQILEDIRPYTLLPRKEYRAAVAEYFSHPDDHEVINSAYEAVLRGEKKTYQVRLKAGKTKYTWCKLDVVPIMENGIPVKMMGILSDIHQMKMQMEWLERKAELDAFTGLFSKVHTEKLVNEVLQKEKERMHACLLIDLDDFKKVNDTYGHQEGDKVIRETAEFLKNSVSSQDIVGRLGGDEFMVFLRDVSGLGEIKEIAGDLLRGKFLSYDVKKSIGIAIYPQNGGTFQELYRKSDLALYQSKKIKNKCTFYNG